MGFFSNFVRGNNDDPAACTYTDDVCHKLKQQFELNLSSDRIESFREHILSNALKKMPADETVLEVAVAYYVAQCVGDCNDRKDAGRLFMRLKPAVSIAGLAGVIPIERALELSAAIKKYTQESVLKDMDEGTGMFAQEDE